MVSGCLTKADVVFMVDSSTSVGSTNFQKLEHFLKVTTTSLTGYQRTSDNIVSIYRHVLVVKVLYILAEGNLKYCHLL